ncbi:hypothetical protein BH09BAC1_BH09BAC1_18020 [soil metagenome]
MQLLHKVDRMNLATQGKFLFRAGFIGLVSCVLCLASTFTSCVEPPRYPNEPAIELVSVSADTIRQLQDSVFIAFKFTDGDGDLGFEDLSTADCELCDSSCYSHPTFTLFILDNRFNIVDGDTVRCLKTFNIPYIPPKGATDAISGVITVLLTNEFCLPGRAVDTVSYSIVIRDRAGNFSNRIETEKIILLCN